MRACTTALNALRRSRLPISSLGFRSRRGLLTLAIETSCDDTSVAILEASFSTQGPHEAVLHFHKKITSDNTQYHGVHPLASLYSHQENLAGLVDEAIQHLPPPDCQAEGDASNHVFKSKRLPDFISVTRGPGMRSNLFTGLDTAKGLAAAWQTDLVGVHHMQAHALTPRLVAALQNAAPEGPNQNEGVVSRSSSSCRGVTLEPSFPFLSVLASGGHTLMIHSATLTDHRVLASTGDIAVGELLDKTARIVLPTGLLHTARTTMYGALLEKFAFSDEATMDLGKKVTSPEIVTSGRQRYDMEDSSAAEYQAMYAPCFAYNVPRDEQQALSQNTTKWGWSLNQPLLKAGGGQKIKSLDMSFSGLMTNVERVVRFKRDAVTGKSTRVERLPADITMEERRDIARETMRAAFEHVASRVVLSLRQISANTSESASVQTVIMSGGVAANAYLRYILASTLVAFGYPTIRLVFPPPSLCTDNAAMIAWAGIEMYQAGHKDPRTIRAIRKWPLDRLLSPPDPNSLGNRNG